MPTIWGTFFSTYRLGSERDRRVLFERLAAAPHGLAPVKFGAAESAREALDRNPDKADSYLKGLGHGGSVYLKGSKHKALWMPSWVVEGVATWQLFVAGSYFKNADRRRDLVDFLVELVDHYQFLYSVVGPQDDWQEKHWLHTDLPGGGTSVRRIGLDLERALPSVSWFTGFGREASEALNIGKVAGLVNLHAEVEGGSTVLVVRDDPLGGTLTQRCAEDERIMAALGRDFFFDLNDPDAHYQIVDGVTRGEVNQQNIVLESEVKEFLNSAVKHPDGSLVSNLADLAEDLIVVLHDQVAGLSQYDLATLEALSRFLVENDQQAEYSAEYLKTEFVPALGAYVGEVLHKKELGSWNVREPIVQSDLTNEGRTIDPFELAFEVVFGRVSLMPRLERRLAGTGTGVKRGE